MEILPCQKILTGRPEGNYKSIISLLVVIVKFNWNEQTIQKYLIVQEERKREAKNGLHFHCLKWRVLDLWGE